MLPVSQSDTSDRVNSIISKNGTYEESVFGPTTQYLMRSRNIATSIFPFDLKIHNQTSGFSGKVVASISDGLTTKEITSTSTINDGTPHHITFVKDNEDFALYIDGTEEVSAPINTLGQVYNKYDMLMGAKFLSDGGFDVTSDFKSLSGSLDEVRIYNKALTAAEIGTLSTNTYANGDAYQTNVVGEVFYKHGLMVISDPRPIYNNVFTGRSGSWDYTAGGDVGFTAKYKSTKELHEVSLLCEISSNDFNVSQNVSLRKNDDINNSILKGFVTGSDFKPYFTTIGLYNDTGDLLAIGKMGSATQVRNDVDITVKVRFDLDGPFGSVTVNELPQETEKDALSENQDGTFTWNKL